MENFIDNFSKIFKSKKEKKRDKNRDIYQRLRTEIEDGNAIRQRMAEAMISEKRNKILYFSVRNDDNAMHKHYHFLSEGDYPLYINDIHKIFESLEYGNTSLLDLLIGRFPDLQPHVNFGPIVCNSHCAYYEV